MTSAGMARKIDSLGRVVIPAGMRRQLGLEVGDVLDIAIEHDRVVLRKLVPACALCGNDDELAIEHQGKLVCRECLDTLRAR